MASSEQKRPGPRAATETMPAAVVEDFARPLVIRMPDGVNLVDAAPLTCAGVTAYKADPASYQSSSIRYQMSDGLPQVLSASRPTRQQVRAGNPRLLEVLVMSSSPGPARPSHGGQGGRR
jgi:hypothetical protein